jgi:hypothetical protein
MFIAGNNTPFAFVTDWRLEYDQQDPNHVLQYWKPGYALMGNKHYWHRTRRIALFEYRKKPTEKFAQFHKYLERGLHTHMILMAPPPPGAGDQAAASGFAAWRAFNPPTNHAEMQYTFWNPPQYPGLIVIPVPYVWRKMKKIQEFVMQRTILWARRQYLPRRPLLVYENYDYRNEALDALVNNPLSVDIEAISSMNLIMAIGLSDGQTSISVPWDAYPVYTGTTETGHEPGLSHRVIREKVLALLAANTPKIFHNASFDVPFLRMRNIPVHGTVHDTWAAHAVLFPGLPHGLQHACATLFPCPPWKSLAKAQWAARGASPSDPKYWLKTGPELRKYNAEDAFYTMLLARRLLPLLNVSI